MNENQFQMQRFLEDDPINNVENHDESQRAEKSENIHFLAHFINIPIVYSLVSSHVCRINVSNLSNFA